MKDIYKEDYFSAGKVRQGFCTGRLLLNLFLKPKQAYKTCLDEMISLYYCKKSIISFQPKVGSLGFLN